MKKNYSRSQKLSNLVKFLYEQNHDKNFTEIFLLFKQLNNNFDKNVFNLFLIYSRNIDDINLIIKYCIDNSIKFNESMYATIIKSYCNHLEVVNSEKFLIKMKENNIKLKQRTYTHFIKMYHQLDDYEKMINLYHEISSKNIKLEQYDYIPYFTTFIKYQDFKIVHAILKQLENNFAIFDTQYLNLFKKIFIQKNIKFLSTNISDNGLCEINKYKLKPLDISPQERINCMITIDLQIPNKKLLHFQKFKQWLSTDKLSKNNIIIDGANIGYFNNRPGKGNKINFSQIQTIKQQLEELNYNVIIILHQRHCDKMNKKQTKIYKSWENNVFLTPIGINDDLFWLYASLLLSAYIITNDRMRDHKLSISYDKMSIWKKKYIITYDIIQNKFQLNFPKKYSQTIQNINNTWYIPFYNENKTITWYFIQFNKN